MRQISFADLDLSQQTAALNLVYRDYHMPFQVASEWVEEHIRAHSIEAQRSPLWLDGRGQVAALALLALRQGRAWIGGFGVAPAYRGNRLSGPVLSETLKDVSVPVQLEVLLPNLKARATYERGGFRIQRQLAVMEGPAGQASDPLEMPGSLCWQRQLASVERMADLTWVGKQLAYRGTQIYFVGPGAVWGELAGQARLRISNEEVGSPLHGQLLRLGWQEVARQYEMLKA